MTIQNIASYPILGRPLFFDLGIVTLLLMLLTISVPLLNQKGIRLIPFRWHKKLAFATLVVAVTHAVLAFIVYL
ncbi:MAG: hypothetical protein A2445_01320 [Candidatus Jacksonbacteria bacterium RIFOXYC2_FULL_44_29]|nr:MAG: hypothetical protein UW45_C0013G0028 [Parcubacteria group bacterium GW2011_GWC2_44_22]OGY76530.1 MAG: hypothetical protein A2295_02135 [Candidatus Jacksonbacteria bacterium RIFOXYB2_FULL_44_15]OGY78510.1 MAG: hypothetical protein A2445_01320 [Candidatus Jacksonbacteria bacterium RIFOXYC2_FULL_44_29]OGY81167.1 MAG: hypothetical protein A2550_01715 [Candidatus Jacksonbacteria bacterium RIFOXYD2_FULL_43_21]HBH45769.1 hypothetical protein [Candidatus Jacksonbacteria bacterium]